MHRVYIILSLLTISSTLLQAMEKESPKQVASLRCIAAQQAAKHGAKTKQVILPEDVKPLYELLKKLDTPTFNNALGSEVLSNNPNLHLINELITACGASVNQVVEEKSLLQHAVRLNHPGLVALLISYNAATKEGFTNLLKDALSTALATEPFNAEVVTLLANATTYSGYVQESLDDALAYLVGKPNPAPYFWRQAYLDKLVVLARELQKAGAQVSGETRSKLGIFKSMAFNSAYRAKEHTGDFAKLLAAYGAT